MIQTVTGLFSERINGNILMHEHVSCISNDMLQVFGDKWLNKEELILYSAKLLSLLKERYNVDLIVDGTPIDLGRDIRVLQKVSDMSGVKIVASTGFYTYPNMVTAHKSSKEISELVLYECEHGIEGTDIKPGILKCAVDSELHDDNIKRLTALGLVQYKTGLPLYLHCDHSSNILDKALDILVDNGASINKIIVGHTAIRCNFEYLKTIIEKGPYICIDQCHCYPNKKEQIIDSINLLCKNGLENKVLFSNDCCIYSDFEKINTRWIKLENISSTFGYIFEKIVSELVKKNNEKSVRKISNENAAKILSLMD